MSERDILLQWLDRAAARLRLNLLVREAGWLASALLALLVLHQVLQASIAASQLIVPLQWLLILAAVWVTLCFAMRLRRRPTAMQAAAVADSGAGLKDELRSAHWFARQASRTPLMDLLLVRACHTARGLDPHALFPLSLPRSVLAALGLALVAAGLAWFSPRLGLLLHGPAGAAAFSSPPAASPQAAPQDERAALAPGSDAAAAERLEAAEDAWSRIEALARQLGSADDAHEIARAVAARDAGRAAELIRALQQRRAIRADPTPAAGRHTEQMSATLAAGILERLKGLLDDTGAAPAHPQNEAAPRPTARLTEQLREEMQDVQRSEPAHSSAGEDALNTLLRAISRNSTGGREVVRGESQLMQEAGRTGLGGGAMGRRVGVSQAGGGDGEQPQSHPTGDAGADPVLGQKTERLRAQLHRLSAEQSAEAEPPAGEDSLYAATQAQASKLDYEMIAAARRRGSERVLGGEELPLGLRDAAKRYTLAQHRREAEHRAREISAEHRR